MKTKNIKYYLAAGIVSCGLASTLVSCSDILDEQPRSQFDTTFFTTKAGIEGGLTSLYAHLRYFYGNGYYLNSCENGTDEYTFAESGNGDNFKSLDETLDANGKRDVAQVTPNNCDAGNLWGQAFTNINTASGIIENGASAGISQELLAEANFFRAFDYFLLVQTFGGVPLDLGSGELKFNTSTNRSSVRNTVPEVYKAIFSDLEIAVRDLPETARLTGTVTKNVARLYLSKAYLTYAWWLKNPNNIPTYPEDGTDATKANGQRTDPNGKTPAQYFQMAYNVAMEAINNPKPYALQETFYDVNVATKDRNTEVMLYADHDENEQYGNGGAGYGWGGGGSPENFAYWFETWNYTEIQALNSKSNAKINPVQREAVQGLGRPWTRIAPVADAFLEGGVWEDAVKAIDSRYDGTFTLSYFTNWDKAYDANTKEDSKDAFVYGPNGSQIKPNEIYFRFVDEASEANIDWTKTTAVINGENQEVTRFNFGSMSQTPYFVRSVKNISRKCYPCNWKIGIYRTDNNGGLGSKVNGGSPRPWSIAKFSEFYLIAAEAAVMGATGSMSARDLVNVLRARAGKQKYSVNDRMTVDIDNSEAMKAATPAEITIDYILDERSREFWGEGYRWYDLVRTQKWAERAGTYKIAGRDFADTELQQYTRDITPGHYLRPIPQGDIDGMEMDDAAKKEYQNPAYR
jgi:hypothetical protein